MLKQVVDMLTIVAKRGLTETDLLCSFSFSETVGTVVTRASAALFCANNRRTRAAQHNNETGA
jgi:hypothetical protein